MESEVCVVCEKHFPHPNLTPHSLVNKNVSDLILKDFPDWQDGKFICIPDLNVYRSEYLKKSILLDQMELSELEETVVKSLRDHELITENLNETFEEKVTLGDRVADKVAEFGGSWKFIIIFFVILASWIVTNSLSFLNQSFDPYPFILLNLILSCLASIQAPIIMMSQNRQAAKDRMRSEMDYKINLKAELEIRHLKSKIDQLSSHQWQRLLEIQQLQTELIQELTAKRNH